MFPIILLFIPTSYAFIVGGCIGPKSAFERYLTQPLKKELRRIVHENFDGSNQAQVLSDVYYFVHSHVTQSQWDEIYPEIERYRNQNHECSVYAQLLPTPYYKQLLASVWRASETGADKFEVKRLVEEYIERLLANGEMEKQPVTSGPPLKPAVPADPIVRRNTPRSAHKLVTPPPVQTTKHTASPPPNYGPRSYLMVAPPPPSTEQFIRKPLKYKTISEQTTTSASPTTMHQQQPPVEYHSNAVGIQTISGHAKIPYAQNYYGGAVGMPYPHRPHTFTYTTTHHPPVIYRNQYLPSSEYAEDLPPEFPIASLSGNFRRRKPSLTYSPYQRTSSFESQIPNE